MIGERIKKLRKGLDLTQQEFANRIGIKRNTIAKYETKRGEPIDAVISLICREFNVSERWLRAGEGEMFIKKEAEPLDVLLDGLLEGQNITTEDRVLIKNFLELPDDSRHEVIRFVQKCAEELATPAFEPSIQHESQDVMLKLAEMEQQNQEMAQQNREVVRQNKELLARLEVLEKEANEKT